MNSNGWLRGWLTTTNHKDIGILYFIGSLFFGFIGALLAVSMRVQLFSPNNDFLTAAAYDQAMTLHGLLMILWFLSPFGLAFANYFVPLQIGAKDMALPRVNAFSYWMYVAGGFLAILGFFLPGGDASTGWTMYAPVSGAQFLPGPGPTLAFAGLIMLGVSITSSGVNILLTIAYSRAPGMTWRKVPMFTWFIAFMLLQALFAFPSLLAALLLLESDRVLGTFFFASSSGGYILWDDLFWFFGHPEVYVVLLPAFGMVAEVLPVFSGRPLSERNLILLATGAVVVPLSYLVWQHHMFITGINLTEDEAFSISTLLISLPFDIIILSFLKTMTKASIRLTAPMLFAIGSIVLFIIGGIAGVFLSSFVLDVVFRGTYFVVAHFHYVMVGAAIFGLFAGLYYYLPRLTGRMYNEALARAHFLVSFIGFNILYFPMFFLYEMPRRIYTYQALPDWGLLNSIATVGAFVFALAQILLLVNLVGTIWRGRVSSPNPWGASGLEWLPRISGGSQSAEPTHIGESHQEHGSSRPFELSVGAGIAFLGVSLLTYYSWGWLILILGLAVVAYAGVGWARDDARGGIGMPEDGPTETWPFDRISKMRLGMWIFLATEVFIFGAILSTDIYIRVNSASWPLALDIQNVPLALWSTVVLLTSGMTALLALQSIRSDDRVGMVRWLLATLALGGAFIAIHAVEWYSLFFGPSPFTWSSGLPGSTYFFTVGLHSGHVLARMSMIVYLVYRARKGGYSRDGYSGVQNFVLFWLFIDLVWLFIFPMFYLS
jgi:cytochrome c oxidase subunit I+III